MTIAPEVEEFRGWLAGEFRSDGRYEAIRHLQGVDAGGADLELRLVCGPRSWYEVRVKLADDELQVGFATESRVINEAVEQMILDNGGDLDDLLGDELSDLGEEPLPMSHFFERPAFRFVVRLPIDSGAVLAEPSLQKRVKAVLAASRVLFQDCVDEGS